MFKSGVYLSNNEDCNMDSLTLIAVVSIVTAGLTIALGV